MQLEALIYKIEEYLNKKNVIEKRLNGDNPGKAENSIKGRNCNDTKQRKV